MNKNFLLHCHNSGVGAVVAGFLFIEVGRKVFVNLSASTGERRYVSEITIDLIVLLSGWSK